MSYFYVRKGGGAWTAAVGATDPTGAAMLLDLGAFLTLDVHPLAWRHRSISGEIEVIEIDDYAAAAVVSAQTSAAARAGSAKLTEAQRRGRASRAAQARWGRRATPPEEP